MEPMDMSSYDRPSILSHLIVCGWRVRAATFKPMPLSVAVALFFITTHMASANFTLTYTGGPYIPMFCSPSPAECPAPLHTTINFAGALPDNYSGNITTSGTALYSGPPIPG